MKTSARHSKKYRETASSPEKVHNLNFSSGTKKRKILRKTVLLSLLLAGLLVSCEVLNQLAPLAGSGSPAPLTLGEVIQGLKTALIVGTDSSSTKLHLTDGYFKDAAVKILLPPEAREITENANKPLLAAIGVKKLIDNVVLSMNRAAEDAAAEAGPIFRQAITNLSFSDAWAILKGSNPAEQSQSTAFDSLAATHYLRSTTYQALYQAFSPKLNQSLDKKLVAGISANSAWNNLTGAYNKVASSVPGKVAGLKPVNTDLSGYATAKALDGLFLKVGEQEKLIRKDPVNWASTSVGNILKRVFGQK